MKRFTSILAVFALATASCQEDKKGEDDADRGMDAPQDIWQDEISVDAPEEDPPPDLVEEEPTLDLPAEDVEEEESAPGNCGNGVVDEGEVCDDGNAVTEYCGGAGACLGDCSLLAENCGNLVVDAGEECDGGADCTTSCTVNDHNIGAPCTCEDAGMDRCSDTNFSAGNIIGCENVAIPEGSGGVVACVRSIRETISGYETFYAGGFCTILALSCEGPLCMFVDSIGDMDTFACPEGYYLNEDTRTVMGSTTIYTKSCLKQCDSPANCRWNEYDDFWSECGKWDCVPAPSDPSVRVCTDIRNTE